MVKFETSVPIRRSPDEVFQFVTAVERIPEWQREGGVTHVVRTDDGPMGPGSRFTMERTSRGRTATIDCEVTSWEPGRRFDFHSIDSAGFVGDFETSLTPTSDGTNLHWSVRMQPPNLVYRLLQPMIANEIRKSATIDFANLKRLLEGDSAAS
jgi:uncharacterized protein YndB with AHSA1/START domain